MSLTRVVLVLVAVPLMVLSADAGVCDGRIFSLRMLGDANGNGKVDLDEIGNGMTVGNPAGWQKATRGNPTTSLVGQEPICFESAELPRAYWNASAVTNVQTFVRFPPGEHFRRRGRLERRTGDYRSLYSGRRTVLAFGLLPVSLGRLCV